MSFKLVVELAISFLRWLSCFRPLIASSAGASMQWNPPWDERLRVRLVGIVHPMKAGLMSRLVEASWIAWGSSSSQGWPYAHYAHSYEHEDYVTIICGRFTKNKSSEVAKWSTLAQPITLLMQHHFMLKPWLRPAYSAQEPLYDLHQISGLSVVQ